jgi:hypothetical protein
MNEIGCHLANLRQVRRKVGALKRKDRKIEQYSMNGAFECCGEAFLFLRTELNYRSNVLLEKQKERRSSPSTEAEVDSSIAPSS